MDIKEEDPISDNMDSQNETNFCTIKTEIKSEISFNDHFIKQIKSETATCSNTWEIDRKLEIKKQTLIADFGSQNSVVNKNYNNEHEIYNKIEVKVEPCWLETETPSVCNDIKDGDFSPVTSSRLCTEVVSDADRGKPSLSFAQGRDTSLYNEKDHLECERQKSDVTEMPTTEHVLSEQSAKYIDGDEIYIRPLYLNKKGLIHKSQRSYKCNICAKGFKLLSHLKTHGLTHESTKPHQCKICDKKFNRTSTLKRHNLIHEGKKPHLCQKCDKSFSRMSHLNTHNLIHEGKRPYQCKTCEKNFTQLANLKRHSLIHEGRKPHQCKTCDKSFTYLSTLKTHNLIHEGKKPHQCKSCDKSFTQLSTLKKHVLIHEGKRPR